MEDTATLGRAGQTVSARRRHPQETDTCPAALDRLLRCTAGEARMAQDLGFSGIALDPFGSAVRRSALSGFDREALPRGLAVVVRVPWQRHHDGSDAMRQHRDWFEDEAGGSGIVDPRRFSTSGGHAVRIGDQEVAEAYADWLARLICEIGEAGADAVWLPSLHAAPEAFWRRVLGALGPGRPLLVGDALGGPFGVLRNLDDAGFAAFIDSSGWWNGHDAWLVDQANSVRTPLLSLGLPSDSRPEVGGDPRLRLYRSLVTSDGHILDARALQHIDEETVRDLNTLRSGGASPAGGALKTAGRGGIVRLDGDPRAAKSALGFGRDGNALIRAMGARFAGLSTLRRVGEQFLAKARHIQPTRRRKPQETDAMLRDLAPFRIAIENVYPMVDCGRFPAKRIVGDTLEVGADIFCDGHDKLAADLIVTEPSGEERRVPMDLKGNDRWTARLVLEEMGLTRFDIEAWRDLFASWRDEVGKKRGAGQDVRLETIEGRNLALPQLRELAGGKGNVAARADAIARAIEGTEDGSEEQLLLLLEDSLYDLLRENGERHQLVRLPEKAEIRVDREQARFSSWYELFPRSMTDDKNRHGTFRDVIERLPYVRDLGFDVLYFPPIHPIGKTNRKGKNNTLTPDDHDVGSPYAIGSEDGGHDAIHPELGDFDDFAALVEAAREHGLEIALDFAIQCSPDHPWLKEHKEWFDWRPDGTIKFAENPPKKYEDIVNVHFYRKALPDIWYALRDVVLFWCEKGVRMFRVDNPHTKPYPFWEWMIAEVKDAYPDALFLSEAFTRPKVMKRLAKLGFTQSYTYYTWRNTKHELTEYLRELTETDTREVMNPNFFVNTPDINPPVLQTNNRDAHIARTWLAGTLASSYGIYNGVEISEGTPLKGKEEYLDSEKYEIRVWDMDREGHIKDEIRLLNELRRKHPALHDHCTLRFLQAYNDQVLWYAKVTPDLSDVLLFAVSLDFTHDQRASIEVPLWYFGLPDDASIEARDIMTGADFTWKGKMQEVTLGPGRIVRAFELKAPEGFAPPDAVLYDDREDF